MTLLFLYWNKCFKIASILGWASFARLDVKIEVRSSLQIFTLFLRSSFSPDHTGRHEGEVRQTPDWLSKQVRQKHITYICFALKFSAQSNFSGPWDGKVSTFWQYLQLQLNKTLPNLTLPDKNQ